MMETVGLSGSIGAVWAGWMVSMTWQFSVLAGVVWIVTAAFRRSSASFRYVLWLLVFARLIVPPSLSAPWSARALAEHVFPEAVEDASALFASENSAAAATAPAAERSGDGVETMARQRISLTNLVFFTWISVAAGLGCGMVLLSERYRRKVLRTARPAPPALSARIARLAREMGVRRRFAVCVAPCLSAPAVFGVWTPCMAVPEALLERLTDGQIGHLLGHELAHIRRGDVRAGWAVSLLMCVYWFNPLVWLASHCLRREREMACDDAVLYATREEGREYAATLIRVAETFSEAVPAGAGFLGLFELSGSLLPRIHSALDAMRPRRSGWRGMMVAAALALFFVPLGSCKVAMTPAAQAPAAQPSGGAPTVVTMTPANGATDVDPGLTAIELTFDRDMGGGFSWTGGGEAYPKTTGKPYWRDKRTCVLPVALEAGRFYRVGINSKSHQNFKSAEGVPALPGVLAFTTRAASGGAPVAALQTPQLVSMTPANGAAEVDPQLTQLTVTFTVEMGGGCSWTGGGEAFPETTGKPQWSGDKKTCTLPVRLKPGWTYRLGLNSPSHKNFQSAPGIPLEPVEWTFSTRN